mgnify:CR=1 FL=1|jgi:hypothetical protein|tara:strand:+ start:2688 stop:3203 length:516 start_codon:yes stop_codon:yes gene_type:complete
MLELLQEIKSRNIKTKAWIAEDPKNRWAGLYPEDKAYWVERKITTLDELERDELATYIYDAHKTAFGCKGRHYDFNAMSLQELKDEADYISKACDEQMELEAKMEKEAVERFETSIKEYLPMAGSREDAIRWILQAEDLDKEWDAGYICYNLGLPYSMEKEFQPLITKEVA